MALRDELKSQGDWMFRWRSYLPVLILPFLFASLINPGQPVVNPALGGSELLERIWDWSCVALSFAGLLLRALIIARIPKGTSGANTVKQSAKVLNTTGMYSLCRNPLYLGNFIIFLGVALFTGDLWFALLASMFFWVYYERIIYAEEEFLRGEFGEEYEAWSKKTPAFFPKLGGWTRPALPFCLRSVLRREFSPFFAVIAVFCFLRVAKIALREWTVRIEFEWAVFFLAGLAVYLILMTLKTFTRLLNAEGR